MRKRYRPQRKAPEIQDDTLSLENVEEEKNMFGGMTVNEKCDLIAELSELVLENPNKAFHSERAANENNPREGKNSKSEVDENAERKLGLRLPSKVQKLLDLGRTHKNGGDEFTASLAIMSLLTIFKDILPAYRIRLPTDAERETIVSKETKELWDYERALLTHYQQFLQLLEKTWKLGQIKEEAPSRLAVTSMLSLCELLKSAFHFNFRSNILSLVVRQMNSRNCEEVSNACCKAVSHVFQNDAQGEVAMETARMVSKLIKDYKGILQPEVLRTFAKLPLRVHVDEAEAAKLAAAANAKKRKRDRDLAEIESEMKEGSASVDKMLLARCQSETLQAVILTYFRILKSPDSSTKLNLLPAALEGLAKFAHLINIDTVIDLLEVLKQLLQNVDTFPLEAALNCLLTAFQTLEGPGREMQIDPKEYITPLYGQLVRLGTEEESKSNTSIMIQCLNSAFLKRREYSNVRLGAFLKQIFTVAQHAPSFTSVPLLAVARQILQQYPGVHKLLESEYDVIASGQYTPDVADPEHSNPFSTVAWELANLKFHIHPVVSEQAQSAATLKMIQLPGESPDRLWADMKGDAEEVYIKIRRMKKKHPLAGNGSGRQQARFITPRKMIVTLLPNSIEDK
jgi:nucleolar complex protein 3